MLTTWGLEDSSPGAGLIQVKFLGKKWKITICHSVYILCISNNFLFLNFITVPKTGDYVWFVEETGVGDFVEVFQRVRKVK